MPFDVHPEVGERQFVNVKYQASSRSLPFAIGVTDRAVYVPQKKRWARTDPWFIQRVPIEQVRQVSLRRTRTIAIVVMALIMVCLGACFTYFMLEPIVGGRGGRVSGWPFAVLVGGILLPFVARGRQTLRVTFTEGEYRWTPPIVIDRASRQYVQQLLAHIVGGFRAAGVQVEAGSG
jgi:hypothetical protein